MITGTHIDIAPRFAAPGFSAAASRGPWSERIAQAVASAHVLVIEDEAMIAWMIESLLEDMGFTSIAIASDGETALRLAAAETPTLLISDINLGAGPDGIETVALIRERSAAPVVFVSGYAGPDARARIDRVIGDAAVLRKPIVERPLRDAIEAVLTAKAH